jgi:hypothetical protein
MTPEALKQAFEIRARLLRVENEMTRWQAITRPADCGLAFFSVEPRVWKMFHRMHMDSLEQFHGEQVRLLESL